MNQEIFSKLKREGLSIVGIFLGLLIITKIILVSESIIVVIRVITSLFWLFIIPGYLIMSYWIDKINFFARALLGTSLSAAILGIVSYHLGIIGIDIRILHIILPIVLIGIGLLILYRKLKIK